MEQNLVSFLNKLRLWATIFQECGPKYVYKFFKKYRNMEHDRVFKVRETELKFGLKRYLVFGYCSSKGQLKIP